MVLTKHKTQPKKGASGDPILGDRGVDAANAGLVPSGKGVQCDGGGEQAPWLRSSRAALYADGATAHDVRDDDGVKVHVDVGGEPFGPLEVLAEPKLFRLE